MGKPCIKVTGSSRPQAIQSKDLRPYRLRAEPLQSARQAEGCYFNTQSCISMDVSAYGRREGVLGIKLREHISNEFHQLSDLWSAGKIH
jgi:hypothetical protein